MTMNNLMRNRKTINMARSGLVVIGSLAFGYLTLQLGFKPYLLEAQQQELQLQRQQQEEQQHRDELIED